MFPYYCHRGLVAALTLFVLALPAQAAPQAEAEAMRRRLENQIARLGLPGVTLTGPAPCFVTRVRGRYRWQVVVRAPRPQDLLRYVTFPLGWQVDVDPVSLL